MAGPSRPRRVWYALLTATTSVLLLAVAPPFLPVEMHDLLRRGFAPVCHQLPSRSPHIAGIPIAICDRCSGIYLGLVIGVVVTGWGGGFWTVLGRQGRYVLLGSLVPLGLDWIGPLLGLWANGPLSRSLTGLLFGTVAASYVTSHVLRRVVKESDPQTARQM